MAVWRCGRRRPRTPVDYKEMTYLANWAERLARFQNEGFLQCRLRQEFAAVLDHRLSIAVGEESEMSDFHKSTG